MQVGKDTWAIKLSALLTGTAMDVYTFVVRLKNYLAKWLELSGSSSGDFDAIVDLIVKEQFINACSEELAVNLLERRPKDLVELTTLAQQYLITHKQQLGGKTKSTVQLNREDKHSLNKIQHKYARGRFSATDATVMATFSATDATVMATHNQNV